MTKKILGMALVGLWFLLALLLHGFSVAGQTVAEPAYLIDFNRVGFLPSTIFSGDTVSLAVTVQNRGLAISIVDLNATLDVGNRFTPIETSDFVGLVQPDSTKSLVFKFRVNEDTFPGYYPVLLSMTYLRKGESVTETQTILVPVSKTEKNIGIRVEPSVINPASQTKLDFFLTNLASTPVSNLSLSWTEANNLILPLGTDNKQYLPFLDANSVANLSYLVTADPNITTGVYPLSVTLSYTDLNGLKTQTTQVGVVIGGGTDFEVSADYLSSGTLSVSVANIGSNNAGAVVVKIPVQPGISISGSNVSILGNLNKGDYTVANFSVSTASDQNKTDGIPNGSSPLAVNSGFDLNARSAGSDQNRGGFGTGTSPGQTRFVRGSAGASVIRVQIDYTDTTGVRRSVEKTVNFSAMSASSAGFAGPVANRNSLGWLPYALLVVLLAGGLGYRHFRSPETDLKKLGMAFGVIVVVFLVVIFGLNANLLWTIAAFVSSLIGLAWFFRRK